LLEKLASNLDGFKGTATQEIVTIRYFGNPVNFQMILKLALMPLKGEGTDPISLISLLTMTFARGSKIKIFITPERFRAAIILFPTSDLWFHS